MNVPIITHEHVDTMIIIACLIIAVAAFVLKVWPAMRKITMFINVIIGTPPTLGRKGVPGIIERVDRIDARLDKLEKLTEDVSYHSKPNHGGSAYDSLMNEIQYIKRKVSDG